MQDNHASKEQKDFLTAAMLSLFVGWLGIDRFYLGKIGTGILKLLTFGGLGIWYVIDLILILAGSMKSKNKQKLSGREKNLKLALIITGVVILLGIISRALLPKPEVSKTTVTAVTTPTTPVTAPTTQTPQAKTEEPSVPAEYKSALSKASSYANTMHMSKKGVYDQLTSEYGEKFSPAAAQYAIDNVKSDWNANALAKAKEYQDVQHMSPSAIHDQLVSQYGEQFTAAEADYAIQHLNG